MKINFSYDSVIGNLETIKEEVGKSISELNSLNHPDLFTKEISQEEKDKVHLECLESSAYLKQFIEEMREEIKALKSLDKSYCEAFHRNLRLHLEAKVKGKTSEALLEYQGNAYTL